MDYFSVVKKSLLDILIWPKVFIPNLFYFIFQIVSTAILLDSPTIRSLFNVGNLEQSIKEELMRQLSGQTLLQVIVSFLIFILFSFFLSVGVEALKFKMMAQIAHERSCSFRKAWKERFRNYIRLGFLKLIIYVMLIAMAALVASPLFAFETKNEKILLLAAAIVAASLIRIAIIFSFQYMFLKKQGPFQAFGSSIWHFIKKPLHSIGSWAVITAAEVFTAIIGLIVYYFIGGNYGKLVLSLVYIIYKVWSEMFLFESLHASKQ